MSILSKDLQISNNQSLDSSDSKTDSTNTESVQKTKQLPSRKQMISDIKDHKQSLALRNNFKRGSAYNMTNLFLKLCNMNFTIYNLRQMTDDQLHAIWLDIKSNK